MGHILDFCNYSIIIFECAFGLDCGNYVWVPINLMFPFFFLNDDMIVVDMEMWRLYLKNYCPIFQWGIMCYIINIFGV